MSEHLTKREQFAILALQGLLIKDSHLDTAVSEAVKAADKLIAKLEKPVEEKQETKGPNLSFVTF